LHSAFARLPPLVEDLGAMFCAALLAIKTSTIFMGLCGDSVDGPGGSWAMAEGAGGSEEVEELKNF